MKITHVIAARLPLKGYGGTERAAYWNAKFQAEAGHDVRVVCLEGSRLDFGRVIPWPADPSGFQRVIPSDTDIIQIYTTP